MAVCTAASISAPEKLTAATARRSRSKFAGSCLWRLSWIPKIAFRSDVFGRSTKNNSSKRPFRINSGGREFTLLHVAATKTGALRSWVQERNDASRREETPASTEAES